ncbi:hypothetical protein [Pseudonocardia sp. KRD291]|uniref:hypothetical protein n=1 Tax=Pseudonocardia sp. KRD291 TaxID=2792007 RepID=UPI001C49FC40|nr:hypothetical protein [Pseudonocardia sp. KRD291]MBW0101471.1 hypothetical protein [Pseudonocardia sp. KRD291]
MTSHHPDTDHRRAENGRGEVEPVSDSAGLCPTAMDPRKSGPGDGRPASAAVWLAGGAVAAGAAIATAHGLYEVAAASGVPPGLAWIYPLITDGLALVAYAATSRLSGRAARYAWTVVVLAAGLSGLAQAAYLAAGPSAGAAGLGGPSPLLRFGVGAWPAVAAAVVAHLLYLLATPSTDPVRSSDGVRGTAVIDTSVSARGSTDSRALPAVNERRAVAAAVHEPDTSAAVSTDHPGTVHARVHPSSRTPAGGEPDEPTGTASAPRDRAARAATAHHDAYGAWPSVRDLAASADVSTGLAAKVLRRLRTNTACTETTDQDPS